MKFKSKQDWWLAAIIWGTLLFAVGSGIFALMTETLAAGEILLMVVMTVLVPGFLTWIVLTTHYVLDDRNLTVRFGPFKKVIPLHSIKTVKKSSNPLSSPALSLKRLEITYGNDGYILISPPDRDEFMDILAQYCPRAKIMKRQE